jgi:hypothetical protein
MGWDGHAVLMVKSKVCTGFWWGDLGKLYAKIILECIFKKWDGASLTGLILLKIRAGGSHV